MIPWPEFFLMMYVSLGAVVVLCIPSRSKLRLSRSDYYVSLAVAFFAWPVIGVIYAIDLWREVRDRHRSRSIDKS